MDIAYIPLTQGAFAIVDQDDFDHLSQWKWALSSTGYAVRHTSVGRKGRQIQMHRVINQTPEGFDTDHINGDRLDNRKNNLRTATRSQNTVNASIPKGVSGYRGVSKHQYGWMAKIQSQKEQIYLGIFKTPEEAAKAYNEAAQAIHGDFAQLNKILSA